MAFLNSHFYGNVKIQLNFLIFAFVLFCNFNLKIIKLVPLNDQDPKNLELYCSSVNQLCAVKFLKNTLSKHILAFASIFSLPGPFEPQFCDAVTFWNLYYFISSRDTKITKGLKGSIFPQSLSCLSCFKSEHI